MVRILSCYENDQVTIVELDRRENGLEDYNYHWLYYDHVGQQLVNLWLRNRDYAGEVAEYYFEQGYLKVKEKSAVFIEKFNFQQHKLYLTPVNDKILNLLSPYIAESNSSACAK